MRLAYAFAIGLVLAALAVPAGAAPYAFSAQLTIQVGALPPVTVTGSGSGTSAGAGGAASIPGGVFSIVTTAPIDPPLLVIDGFGVGAPGQGGTGQLPLDPGTNQALAWNGVTGQMPLDASAYLITGYLNGVGPTPNNAAAVPLNVVGVGGTKKFVALGTLIMATIKANPYQLGMVTVMGALNGSPSTVMGTGFDNRTAGGLGTLQLVSPTIVSLGALGALAVLNTITIFNVPEPSVVLLLAGGLVGLGALRRRFAS
jgi:hypothetical protein